MGGGGEGVADIGISGIKAKGGGGGEVIMAHESAPPPLSSSVPIDVILSEYLTPTEPNDTDSVGMEASLFSLCLRGVS